MRRKYILNQGLPQGDLKWKLMQICIILTIELRYEYMADDQFRKMRWMLDGLAFLPPQLLPEALSYIREKSPGDIGDLLDYFDCTYVKGHFRVTSAPSAAKHRTNSSICLTVGGRRPKFPRNSGIHVRRRTTR